MGALLVIAEGGTPLLPDGLILFNGNQSWFGQGAVFASQIIQTIGSGDINFNGNQSTVLTSPDASPLFVNTLLEGRTIRASDNRFKEPPGSPQRSLRFSLSTHGIVFNNTSNNQGDHCILASSNVGAEPPVAKDNQIVDPGSCDVVTGIAGAVMSTFTFEGPISRD